MKQFISSITFFNFCSVIVQRGFLKKNSYSYSSFSFKWFPTFVLTYKKWYKTYHIVVCTNTWLGISRAAFIFCGSDANWTQQKFFAFVSNSLRIHLLAYSQWNHISSFIIIASTQTKRKCIWYPFLYHIISSNEKIYVEWLHAVVANELSLSFHLWQFSFLFSQTIYFLEKRKVSEISFLSTLYPNLKFLINTDNCLLEVFFFITSSFRCLNLFFW